MVQYQPIESQKPKDELYRDLAEIVQSLTESETNFIANCANVASLLFNALNNQCLAPTQSSSESASEQEQEQGLSNVNWFGFYFADMAQSNTQPNLCLGPFHGKPACTRIKYGKGVCGTCQSRQETIIVPNVHKFDGHIACDSASNSEICVPIFSLRDIHGDDTTQKRFVGLIDVDSPKFAQFDEADREGLEQIAAILGRNCDWSPLTGTPSQQ